MKNLMRDYERARYPEDRRLDVHGEGPKVARDRALQWIQSRAHESPGQELLLIVERGRSAGRRPTPVTTSVQTLLTELQGRLIDWWQPFAPGSIALRVSATPRMEPLAPSRRPETGDGRTDVTSGVAWPSPLVDIPEELLAAARRTTAMRLEREGLTIRLEEVVLREVWIEVQARAMDRRITFAEALEQIHSEERARQIREM
jgi:hypothetical protein